MRIVITAGGVKEKIDNVRSITNSSTGKLGQKIAKCFLEKEPNCELIYIYGGTAEPYMDDKNRVQNIFIKDTENLLNVVSTILTSVKVDIFIHSMAVADYTTESVIDFAKLKSLVEGKVIENFDSILNSCVIDNNGKVSSDITSPAIVLRKTPKVIECIKKLSPYTFLVGFKLLDDVPEDNLFATGFNLLRKNRCNLVLANDISKIRVGNHIGMLIYPEKNFDMIEGKDNIALFLVEKTLERYNVKHPKSIQRSTENNISEKLFLEFAEMGKWLDKNDFLPRVVNHNRLDKIGTYGNMSMRKGHRFYITCRNVNKCDLKKTDISQISSVKMIDKDNDVYSNVFYNSELKPSIDTTIHACIYRYSNFNCIVHIHTDRVFLGYPLVSEMYPCGSNKECLSIIDFVVKDPFVQVIQMRKHGLIVMGNSFNACKEKINHLFNDVPCIDYGEEDMSEECLQHIQEVAPSFVTEKNLYSLKLGEQDIGCVFEDVSKDIVNFGIFTRELIRGKGLHIVEKYLKLYDKTYILHTTKKCEIFEFYKNKYGFKELDMSNSNDLKLVLRGD